MKSAVPAYSNFTVVIPVRKLEWVTIVNLLLFIDLYSSFCLLPLICFVSCVIMSLPETNVKSDAGVNTRGKRFTYKPHHMILLMRQVAADNHFQYDCPSERHAENDRAKKQSKIMKKRKEETVSEVQAGKNIREASLMTMKRTAGRCSYYPDQLARILRLPCGTVRLF